MEAEASLLVVGGLGNGAGSLPLGAGAGVASLFGAGVVPPQPQPTSQPVSQPQALQQWHFLPNKPWSNSKTGRQRFLQQVSQVGSQAGSQAFTGQQASATPHSLTQAFLQNNGR
jgi:hypothetical protein